MLTKLITLGLTIAAVCIGVALELLGNLYSSGAFVIMAAGLSQVADSKTWPRRRQILQRYADYYNKMRAPWLNGLTSDAGRWIESQFCDKCGTTVGWTLEFLPAYHGIAGGTFDAPTFWYRFERFFFARSNPD